MPGPTHDSSLRNNVERIEQISFFNEFVEEALALDEFTWGIEFRDLPAWNLRGREGDLSFNAGGQCPGFVVVKFTRADDRNVSTFIEKLQGFANARGMRLGRREGDIVDAANWSGQQIEANLDATVRRIGPERVGLVIAVIGDKVAENARQLYPAIKRWSHANAMIPTQCVQVSKCTGKLMTSPQYAAGVLLKINLKLGGNNAVLKAPSLGLLKAAPTMVMGFDVNHPPPGSMKPSYSALFAFLDGDCTVPFTVIGSQKSRQEIYEGGDKDVIQGFVEKVRSCLRAFHQKNGLPPQRILFFRDGVAHNMFDKLKQREVAEIFEACRSEGGADYVPLLTFIVVQQRTRALFANVGNKTQVAAGTLITTEIVSEDGKDWYMVAQHGLKGTSRPLHFHLVQDDANHKKGELQRLTFDLCHLYQRATKIVSRPAPVYYAHRAAFLAQYYQDNYKEEVAWEVGSTTSTGSAGSHSSVPSVALGPAVARTVYFA